MTNKEAIEILRDTPIDIRSTREDDILTLYATAQNMAIEALKADAVHNDSCDGCKYGGVIEKCELCRRIYAEFDDLYDKGGDSHDD